MTITPILFIGPVRAGKSTVVHLVAARLKLPHISLDELRWSYYREIGYEENLV
jgi:adenylate kinase family enzyme